MRFHVLIVESLPERQKRLKALFGNKAEFLCQLESRGERAIECVFGWSPDCVVMNASLGDLSGARTCALIKQDERIRRTPVILYSARPSQEHEVLQVLQAGADEFIQPCPDEEFLWRVRSVIRRYRQAPKTAGELIRAGPLTLDTEGHRAWSKGRPVRLTKTEFELLELFLRSKDKVLSRTRILESLKGFDSSANVRAVDLHVSRLKRKLGGDSSKLIESVYGLGYRLRPADS